MDATYPKKEKLKSQKTIGHLFSEGQSVAKYPLRLVFSETKNQEEKLLLGVSVSKKHFKNAVDRNYFKRVLRECYRLNKSILHNQFNKTYAVMFFYQTKERLSYQEINEKTIQLFEKWVKKIQEYEQENQNNTQ
jgi:ribonuclease P protein component